MDAAARRAEMVASLEHETKGLLESDRVAAAMRAVPRHEFVDEADHRAYLDQSFEHRESGSTVVAPSTVARLLETLAPRGDDSVLVVGAGVGYTAAVLAAAVGERQVHAVEIDRGLVYEARENLATADQSGVLVDRGDGAEGLPDYAPFDRILVEAAAVEVPAALRRQLASGGRVVFPRGNGPDQRLVAVDAAGETVADGGPVGFAPLLVEGEQRGAVERNRTHREDRERAARAAESRAGWEQEWIDWERR